VSRASPAATLHSTCLTDDQRPIACAEQRRQNGRYRLATWRGRRLETNAVWSTGVVVVGVARIRSRPRTPRTVSAQCPKYNFRHPRRRCNGPAAITPKRLLGFITSPRNDVIACVTSSIKLSFGDQATTTKLHGTNDCRRFFHSANNP